MPEETDQKRFEELVGLLLDGEIRKDELDELTVLAKAHPSLTRLLQEHLLMDSGLYQYENASKSAQAFLLALEERVEAEEGSEDFVRKVVNHVPQSWSRWIGEPLAWAAGICFLLGIGLVSSLRQGAAEEDFEPGVAVASRIVGTAQLEDRAIQDGEAIGPGVVTLKEGFLELEFYRGARVTLAGPAELELVDAGTAICRYGKIRAYVPGVARGFTILTPESKVVDLGTEFGLEVLPTGETQVHVIEGEVEVYEDTKPHALPQLVTADQAMRFLQASGWTSIPTAFERFAPLAEVDQLEEDAALDQARAWARIHRQLQEDSRVIAYYDFQRESGNRRVLPNRAMTGAELDGAIVGAHWSEGPWPDKQALDFKRPGDRVRLHLPGQWDQLTLAAWVRVDGLDRSHNSLLLTDGYDPGEVHWQFQNQGTLVLGYRGQNRGRNHDAKRFVDLTKLGQWLHVATTLDRKAQTVSHYQNGELVQRVPLNPADVAFRFGDASIGNWVALEQDRHQIRTFNGRMAELVIFEAALDGKEIRALALR